jgi:anti-sigma factor RsiW
MVVNCEHVWQEISNFIEGDVDPALRSAMEAHFKECKHCTAVLDGTRDVVKLYGDDRMFELPAGFSERLQSRLARETFRSCAWTSRYFWSFAVAAVALIVGGLSLGSSAVFRQPDLRSPLAQSPHGIPSSLLVALSDDGRVFHVPGCKYLHRRDNESPKLMSAQDALRQGYAPCVRCLKQYLSARVECARPNLNGQSAEPPEVSPRELGSWGTAEGD